MNRIHLFEIEDQSWFPDSWRRYVTEYLQFLMRYAPLGKLPEVLARVVDGGGPVEQGHDEQGHDEQGHDEQGHDEQGRARIVDLCSGSGGPWPSCIEDPPAELADVEVLLTDLHPNRAAFERIEERTGGRVRGWPTSIDATDVPEELDGARTLINGFHHFRPEQARQILEDAVAQGAPIGVFEVLDRRPITFLTTMLLPGALLVATPFIRPLSLGRLFWTYVVPVVPAVVLWDGLVSILRVYSPEELRDLVDGLDDHEWELDVVSAGWGPTRITYLVGKPRETVPD